MRSLVLAFMLSLLSVPALASDGVVEINQTCAVQTGCFAGDTPGFPVTIDGSAGRSYRLTGDLVLSSEFTTGIRVNVDDVSIDLAGFEIRGPVVCSGSPLGCNPSSGTGAGITRSAADLSGMSVHDGSIRGMGSIGVVAGIQSEVRNVRVRSSGSYGIYVSYGSTVTGSTATRNGYIGIYGGNGSTLSGNTAYQNREYGIYGANGSTVSGNTVYQNEQSGIYGLNGATVVNNTAYQNGSHGIETVSGCTVRSNTARMNAGYGLYLGPQTGYRENVITGNTTGTVGASAGGSPVNLGDNACNGTSMCP